MLHTHSNSDLANLAMESDVAITALHVKSELERSGYAILPRTREEKFLQICGRLGEIIEMNDIRIEAGVGSMARSAAALPLHTDSPLVNFIGWQCHRAQSPTPAPTYILDMRDVFTKLSPETLQTLTKIPHLNPELEVFPCETFVIQGQAEDQRLHFVPWRLPQNAHSEIQLPINQLIGYVERKLATNLKLIELKEQECLFLDNRTMLHGRGGLDPASLRHLRRVWLR